jgi:hypothetical protein
MNSQGINYNTRFAPLRDAGIGEGIESTRTAKASTKADGDYQSNSFGDVVLHRQRA